jgi:lysine decarboxylase
VTSAHKTLPSWSQAALILARTERIDIARLDRGVEATHTTSPAGAILASIDAARALLARDGSELLGALVNRVARARARLATVEGLVVLDGPHVDPTKCTLVLSGTGAHGVSVERDLLAAGLPVEMADRDTIVAILTRDDDTRISLLVERSCRYRRHRGSPRAITLRGRVDGRPVTIASPARLFSRPKRPCRRPQP